MKGQGRMKADVVQPRSTTGVNATSGTAAVRHLSTSYSLYQLLKICLRLTVQDSASYQK